VQLQQNPAIENLKSLAYLDSYDRLCLFMNQSLQRFNHLGGVSDPWMVIHPSAGSWQFISKILTIKIKSQMLIPTIFEEFCPRK